MRHLLSLLVRVHRGGPALLAAVVLLPALRHQRQAAEKQQEAQGERHHGDTPGNSATTNSFRPVSASVGHRTIFEEKMEKL